MQTQDTHSQSHLHIRHAVLHVCVTVLVFALTWPAVTTPHSVSPLPPVESPSWCDSLDVVGLSLPGFLFMSHLSADLL